MSTVVATNYADSDQNRRRGLGGVNEEGGRARMSVKSLPFQTIFHGTYKAWIRYDGSSTGHPSTVDFNVASTTDDGLGLTDIAFTNSFSSTTSYSCLGSYTTHNSTTITDEGGQNHVFTRNTGSIFTKNSDDAATAKDAVFGFFQCIGAQA